MKKLLMWLTLPLLFVGCTAELESKYSELESRVAKLETLCSQLNTNISSLQTIVTALQNNDYVTSVSPITQGGEEIGYTISFSKSKSITIYHGKNGTDGKDGVNGTNGKDGQTPVIGVRNASDGIYYWTVNGEWLLDTDGNKIKAIGTDGKDGQNGTNGQDGKDGADGITPQLKIVEGYWQISYDNGMTWSQIGKAVGDDGKAGKDGDSFFQSVDTSDPAFVIFTLSDGTVIKMPTWASFEKLQILCNQMNTNISAMQTILTAVQERDYVISVAPLMDNGKEVGQTITFSKSGVINIYHGKDGKEGTAPIIGIKQDTDGLYYWTLNGEFILDNNGDKVVVYTSSEGTETPAVPGPPGENGVTPMLKIETGYWYVSYDEGETWSQLGKATGDAGESFLRSIDTSDPNYIIFTLADGSTLKIPTWASFEKLQTLCNEMNSNISALQAVVTALQDNDYVKSVTPIIQDGKEVGYTISFSKSGSVNIYHGKDGDNGTNGITPLIGAKADADGIYYWTVNGEWLLDESGKKVKATGTPGGQGERGVTPLLKIENGYWFVSYNDGQTWSQLGKATGNDGATGGSGDSFFQSVDNSNTDYVIFTLADGSAIKIPTWASFERLQTLCNQMNTNIFSIQTIIAALQDKDYVVSVVPLMDNGKEVGYTITFSKSGSVNIYHGKDGATGVNGSTPVIGVKADTDGIYYWTVDGEWLLDESGKKVKAQGTDGQNGTPGTPGENGVTPQLKIENGYWFVSYNNGQTWSQLGKATGEDGQPGAPGANGDSFFQSVDTSNPDYIVLILADGTNIEIPRNKGIIGQIQSISYIPKYSDGIALVNCPSDGSMKTVELDFFISPSNIASKLALSGQSMLSVEAVYNQTRALINTQVLEIISVQAENGYLKVVASCENLSTDFFNGACGATICLKVTDGDISLCSDYIPILASSSSTTPTGVDLSQLGSANSYIITNAGTYKFKTVQGNSSESVGDIASVEVLWETFGTDTAPNVGDLVKNVSYSDNYVTFEATNKKGNASIAVKDASNKILWSWHIWMTDQPEEQVYYNNAGTMMDRNLGATSATPGDVGTLGLLYQWGRKDPFLGSSSISTSVKAISTKTWPVPVESDHSTGTIKYSQEHPMTFINQNNINCDWFYQSTSTTDNTRWQSDKSKYDPCPVGWKVPYGGNSGVWSKALGSSSHFVDETLYDNTKKGINFSGKFGSAETIWYPSAGIIRTGDILVSAGFMSRHYSTMPYSYNIYGLDITSDGKVIPSIHNHRTAAASVRCCKE